MQRGTQRTTGTGPSKGLTGNESPAMRAQTPAPLRMACVAALVGCLASFAAPALLPAGAAADDAATIDFQSVSSPVTDAIPSEIQQRVEDTAAAYNEAVAMREDLEAQIAENQQRIDELEAQLPELQERAAEAMRTTYRFQQNGGGLVELILSSESFDSFISMLMYLNAAQESSVGHIEELAAAQAELTAQRSELDAALQQAQEQEAAAQEALAQAQAAREEAQRQAEEQARRAVEERAAAQAQAEAEAAAQAQAATQAGAAATDAASGAQPNQAPADDGSQQPAADDAVVVDEPPAPDAGAGGEGVVDAGIGEVVDGADGGDATSSGDEGSADGSGAVDWSSERDAFVAQWAGRIDAYLAGSPMAGQGATFAAAAWDYGVDPRFSPAIAFVESTLGAYCFLPYNAWGWGSSSWGSWEEAIYAHVAGLSRGYGPTLDYEDALSYCPPNADEWYNLVLSKMNSI